MVSETLEQVLLYIFDVRLVFDTRNHSTTSSGMQPPQIFHDIWANVSTPQLFIIFDIPGAPW
jgi:hypothetical protein